MTARDGRAGRQPPRALSVGPDGWIPGVQHQRSPNFDDRPFDAGIGLIVVHNISLPPGRYGQGHVTRLFTNALEVDADPFFDQISGARVSAHLLIERDGGLIQFVSLLDRAWHAGDSEFEGQSRCNDFSIGIELEGTDFEPFTDSQYESLGAAVDAIVAAYPIRAVRGHSDIAPGRKTDPGPFFDWHRIQVPSGVSLPRPII